MRKENIAEQCNLPYPLWALLWILFVNFFEISISSNQNMKSALVLHKWNTISCISCLSFSPLSNLLSHETFTSKNKLCRGSILNFSLPLLSTVSVWKGEGGDVRRCLKYIRNTEELKDFLMPINIWRSSVFQGSHFPEDLCSKWFIFYSLVEKWVFLLNLREKIPAFWGLDIRRHLLGSCMPNIIER